MVSCGVKVRFTPRSFLRFQNSNCRFQVLNVFSISKCAWRPNFTFFGIFLLFLNDFWKSVFGMNSVWTVKSLFKHCSYKKTDFQKSFKNSKKIPKNVKFSFQAHFNMENMFSTWNRQFEFWKRKFEREVKTRFTSQLTIAHLSLYIYIGQSYGAMDSIEALRATAQISSFHSKKRTSI